MKNSDSRQPVRDLAASPDYAVLSFASHRARKRSGVASVGRAVYSFRRASKGGYYLVPSTVAADVLDREISGVSRLRAPYSDLLECW